MTTPHDPNGEVPSSGSGLPPHLDPRGSSPRDSRSSDSRSSDSRKGPPPRVTNAYRQAARGGPAAKPVLGPPSTGPRSRRDRRRDARFQRSRGQRFARVLSWIALSMAAVVLVLAGGLYLAFNHYIGRIQTISIGGIKGHKAPPKAPGKAENFLLVGSDSRAGENGVGDQAPVGSADYVRGQRSDTVILMHLFGSSDKAELVSFPRDSWVQIPAYTDPKTKDVTPAHFDKLNSAFSEGGPSLLIATIENMTDIRVDHFIEVDFEGFKNMTDKLGGVNVCLTQPAKDHYSGIDLSAGEHHISGDVALAFVRQRHGLPNGDIDRIARQQQFIGALANKVLSAGTLLNPLKLNGFLDAATSSLQVDNALSAGDIKKLVLRLRGFSSGNVLFTTVPITNIGGRRDGQSVVLLDDSGLATMMAALRADRAPAPAPKAVKITVPATAVHVEVLNGTGVKGKGALAASDLTQVGFNIVGAPGNASSHATRTVVLYGPNRAESAKTLQAALPGSAAVLDPTLTGTLHLIVGTDYSGAKPVKVTPVASSNPLDTPTVKTAANNACTV